MTERDMMAELAQLADQLRATIAELDERIEARARQIAAQRGPASIPDIVEAADEPLRQLGEMMRQDMMERAPDLSEFTARISTEAWMASAASLLASVYASNAKERRNG